MVVHSNSLRISSDNAKTALRIFGRQKQGLKICHINAQSLYCKIDEFRLIFEGSDVDIVCISETWFSHDLPDSFVALRGYRIFRSDRLSHGGGVAVFVKTCINCKVILRNDNNSTMEYLLLEIIVNNQKFLLCVAYRPNRRTDVTILIDAIQDLCLRYTKVLIVGDLNSDLLTDNTINDQFQSLGLSAVNESTATHFTSTSSTLLDVFFVSDKSLVLFYGQLPFSQFSHHDLIFLTFNLNQQSTDNLFRYRDFKNINFQLLDADFDQIDWQSIFSMTTADEQVDFLNQNILYLFEKHVPYKTRRIENTNQPWYNHAVGSLILRRNQAYSKWKRYRTPAHFEAFSNLRKEAVRAIRQAKCQYFAEKFANASNSKATWRTIRDIGLNKTCTNKINTDLNTLNNNFAGNLNCDSTDFTMQTNCDITESDLNSYCDTPLPSAISTTSSFSFVCASESEVFSSLIYVKSNSTGLDGITPKFLKLLLPKLVPVITHIFNTIFTKSVFPKKWKLAKIIPIPKSGDDFRPIAILPYLSKAFEYLMYKQMSLYFTSNCLLTDRQSGFRPKRSCTTAVIDVSESVRQNIEANKPTFLILLDCSKAFNSINHFFLCYKLKNWYGFSTTAIKLIFSYMSDRFQCVCSGDLFSDFVRVSKGVPQGSVLGPFLFSVYVNDFPTVLHHCSTHMYADDIQLYVSCDKTDICSGVNILNLELQRVGAWATLNELEINPRKSKCLLIYKKPINYNSLPEVVINDSTIEYVSKAKNLGFIFNNTLSWNDHIISASGKVNGMLRYLWPTQYFTPLRIRLLIAKTYLLPILLFGCEVFANADSIHKQKLKVAYNNIARYVFNLRRFDHVSEYAHKLNNTSFENLVNTKVLQFVHKLVFSGEPIYLAERLRFTQSRRNNDIVLPRHSCLLSERQFLIHGIRLWNSLDNNTQQISNAINFKKKLLSASPY